MNFVCAELELIAEPVTSVEHVRQLALIASNQDSRVAALICQVFEHESLTIDSISIGGSTSAF